VDGVGKGEGLVASESFALVDVFKVGVEFAGKAGQEVELAGDGQSVEDFTTALVAGRTRDSPSFGLNQGILVNGLALLVISEDIVLDVTEARRLRVEHGVQSGDAVMDRSVGASREAGKRRSPRRMEKQVRGCVGRRVKRSMASLTCCTRWQAL
jgi:hypothetical protein